VWVVERASVSQLYGISRRASERPSRITSQRSDARSNRPGSSFSLRKRKPWVSGYRRSPTAAPRLSWPASPMLAHAFHSSESGTSVLPDVNHPGYLLQEKVSLTLSADSPILGTLGFLGGCTLSPFKQRAGNRSNSLGTGQMGGSGCVEHSEPFTFRRPSNSASLIIV
jgi:hypothetical protein